MNDNPTLTFPEAYWKPNATEPVRDMVRRPQAAQKTSETKDSEPQSILGAISTLRAKSH